MRSSVRRATPADGDLAALLPLFTDGLVEARDGSGVFLPMLAQRDVLTEPDAGTALDELLRRVREHCGGEVHDDVAVLLVDRCAGRDGRPPTTGTAAPAG